jgi:hypothetical protein
MIDSQVLDISHFSWGQVKKMSESLVFSFRLDYLRDSRSPRSEGGDAPERFAYEELLSIMKRKWRRTKINQQKTRSYKQMRKVTLAMALTLALLLSTMGAASAITNGQPDGDVHPYVDWLCSC